MVKVSTDKRRRDKDYPRIIICKNDHKRYYDDTPRCISCGECFSKPETVKAKSSKMILYIDFAPEEEIVRLSYHNAPTLFMTRREYLEREAARFQSHGRRTDIKSDGNGKLALYIDKVA